MGKLFKPLLTTEEKLLLDVQLLYLMETVRLATFNAPLRREDIKKETQHKCNTVETPNDNEQPILLIITVHTYITFKKEYNPIQNNN